LSRILTALAASATLAVIAVPPAMAGSDVAPSDSARTEHVIKRVMVKGKRTHLDNFTGKMLG
jgi:hypothetical protein